MASPPSKRSSAAAVPVEAVVAGCETLRDIASKLVVQQGQCAFSGLKFDGNARALTLRVLAKGADNLAEKIKEIARENRIPIRENVPLARALYKSTEVGDMIPEELYKAVASVLASIWKLKPKAGKP